MTGLDVPAIITIVVLFFLAVGKTVQAVANWREQVRWESDNEGHDGFIW